MSSNYPQIATDWAVSVRDGKEDRCQYVRQACARFIHDLHRPQDKNFPFIFSPDEAQYHCDFISNLPHVSGLLASAKCRFVLQPWQVFVDSNLFGGVNPDNGQRRIVDHVGLSR